MAKQTLPTNFKDDVLAASMGGKRRYILTENGDGTFTLEDATTYNQVGDVFGAARLNALCGAVNESVDQAKVIDSIDTIKATTQAGYPAGSLAVKQIISEIASFQTGVDTIYSGCVTYGSTPTAKTPAAIVNAIKAIYTNRYNNGKTDAENYILGNPNLYNLYTQAQYNANYNSGVAAAKTFQRAEFSKISYTTENTYVRVTTFDLSSIPNIAAKTLWKDIFVHPGNCHLWQQDIGSVGPTFTLSGSVLTAKQSQITIETIVVYYSNT